MTQRHGGGTSNVTPGVPWPAIIILAGFAAALMVTGCNPVNIGVVQPDVSINPPAALMQPTQPYKGAIYTDAKTAPVDDGSAGASGAATAPKAPAAAIVAPNPVSPISAPALNGKPVAIMPPDPNAGKPRETGRAPMPSAPQ